MAAMYELADTAMQAGKKRSTGVRLFVKESCTHSAEVLLTVREGERQSPSRYLQDEADDENNGFTNSGRGKRVLLRLFEQTGGGVIHGLY